MTILVVTINWGTGQLIAGSEERQSKTQSTMECDGADFSKMSTSLTRNNICYCINIILSSLFIICSCYFSCAILCGAMGYISFSCCLFSYYNLIRSETKKQKMFILTVSLKDGWEFSISKCAWCLPVIKPSIPGILYFYQHHENISPIIETRTHTDPVTNVYSSNHQATDWKLRLYPSICLSAAQRLLRPTCVHHHHSHRSPGPWPASTRACGGYITRGPSASEHEWKKNISSG